MNTARRLIKLQRQIHKTVRADVRRAYGLRTRELRRYYDAYKREFRGPSRQSSKEELLKACLKADVILMGDYHTFAQSQKAALRLLRDLVNWSPDFALGLEMVPSSNQADLDQYMAGSIDDAELLRRIDYSSTWGFPWENFKPLLTFAREHNILVIALNHRSENLEARDEHAASVIAAFTAAYAKTKLFAIYGDLHLARGHIPKRLKAELSTRKLKRRIVTVFQNSETLYWRLAEQGMAHAVDVLSIGRDRYCIINAPPWVKLQSYLEWTESGMTLDHEDAPGLNLHEIAHDRLKNLAEALNLNIPENFDFTIQTINDLGFLKNLMSSHGLTRNEAKAVKYHVLGNRHVFIPSAKLMYLASSSTNAMNEGVAVLAHAIVSRTQILFHDPREHFFSLLVSSMLAYFGSKVLNHKRKCDLEDDFKLQLEQPLERGALPAEKLQRKVAKFALKHCQAQREYLKQGRYRAPVTIKGPSQMPVFLESARQLGHLMGEKLYSAYAAGSFPSLEVERLFLAKLADSRAARVLYLKLVGDLQGAPLSHTSKLDLL